MNRDDFYDVLRLVVVIAIFAGLGWVLRHIP